MPAERRSQRASRAALRLAALTVVTLGFSTVCTRRAESQQTQRVSARPRARAIDEEVSAWLDRAANAPHNGSNPVLELPERLIVEGASAWERAVVAGPTARRRDAVSAYSRHPSPSSTRTFWRSQLTSDDAAVRFRALTTLADAHAPEDFELIVTRAIADPGARYTLSARLGDWGDRRAVPVLAPWLDDADSSISESAALSLSRLPGVPALGGEVVGSPAAVHLPNGAWRAPQTSRLPPYRRWWRTVGRDAFHAERQWLDALAARVLDAGASGAATSR